MITNITEIEHMALRFAFRAEKGQHDSFIFWAQRLPDWDTGERLAPHFLDALLMATGGWLDGMEEEFTTNDDIIEFVGAALTALQVE